MTRDEAQHLAYIIIWPEASELRPRALTRDGGATWVVRVREPSSDEVIDLPDAFSWAAYRSARRGSWPAAGAPDF